MGKVLGIDLDSKERSAVRFLLVDSMVSGSNQPTAKLSLRVRRVASFPSWKV